MLPLQLAGHAIEERRLLFSGQSDGGLLDHDLMARFEEKHGRHFRRELVSAVMRNSQTGLVEPQHAELLLELQAPQDFHQIARTYVGIEHLWIAVQLAGV